MVFPNEIRLCFSSLGAAWVEYLELGCVLDHGRYGVIKVGVGRQRCRCSSLHKAGNLSRVTYSLGPSFPQCS